MIWAPDQFSLEWKEVVLWLLTQSVLDEAKLLRQFCSLSSCSARSVPPGSVIELLRRIAYVWRILPSQSPFPA